MPRSTHITAEELLLDSRFIAWAKGKGTFSDNQWVENLRKHSENQEFEVVEALVLYNKLFISDEISVPNVLDQKNKLLDRINRENLRVAPKQQIKFSKPILASLFFLISISILGSVFYFNYYSSNNIIGDGKATQLVDGTQVKLSPSSTLTLNNNFSFEKSREVWVKGEAHFHVSKKLNKQPFLVHTKAFDIEVTGTQFTVNNTEDLVSVLLQEGSVNLHFPGGEVVRMKPGDFFSINEISNDQVVVKDRKATPSQLERHIVFDNTPISQVIREIESRYNVTIYIESDELKTKQITGILPNDNLLILLDALGAAMDCKITNNNNNIIIKASN